MACTFYGPYCRLWWLLCGIYGVIINEKHGRLNNFGFLGGDKVELHVISHEEQSPDDLIRWWGPIAPWVDAFHLRYKQRSVVQIAEIIQHLQGSNKIPFSKLIINSHLPLAIQFGCAGVHLPEHLKVDKNWQSPVRQMRIGRSVHSLAGARKVEMEGIDYMMVGHIFPSLSKPGLPPLGLEQLRQIVTAVRRPVIAVGGIQVDQVQQVMATGCAGIAVLSAVTQHPDPLQVVQAFRRRGNIE
jgi:thiazole tautomerase (transcriptional regulator TenI)